MQIILPLTSAEVTIEVKFKWCFQGLQAAHVNAYKNAEEMNEHNSCYKHIINCIQKLNVVITKRCSLRTCDIAQKNEPNTNN